MHFKKPAIPSEPVPPSRTDALFHAYRFAPSSDAISVYLVESTAQIDVDAVDAQPTDPASLAALQKLTPLANEDAAETIARVIAPEEGSLANVVIFVHGFNNPRRFVLGSVERFFDSLAGDPALSHGSRRQVFIVYRWPAEMMGGNWRSCLRAAPVTVRVILALFLLVYAIGLLAFNAPPGDGMLVTWIHRFQDALVAFAALAILLLAGWSPRQLSLRIRQFSLKVRQSLAPLTRWQRLVRSLTWLLGATAVGASACAVIFALIFFGKALTHIEINGQPLIPDPVDSVRVTFWFVLFILLFCVPFALILERTVTYFRDLYRATNYGVPDLANFLRALDAALAPRLASRLASRLESRPTSDLASPAADPITVDTIAVDPSAADPRGTPGKDTEYIKLSFLAHSMGALVATNLVRLLADAFPDEAPAPRNSKAAAQERKHISGAIGKAFDLDRLVLISPDMPAEALLTRRSNFLQSSLRRFKETYLFSNGGDEVLRLVSTVANYFSFPTQSSDSGFRLGNVEVRPKAGAPPSYGIVNRAQLAGLDQDLRQAPNAHARTQLYKATTVAFLSQVRIGARTLFNILVAVDRPAVTSNETSQQAKAVAQKAEGETVAAETTRTKAVAQDAQAQSAGISPAADLILEGFGIGASSRDLPFPVQVTYLDFTNYIDFDPKLPPHSAEALDKSNWQPKLALKSGRPHLSPLAHSALLFQYLIGPAETKVDVHSGYFYGPYARRLMLRLTCLGWEGLLQAEASPEKTDGSATQGSATDNAKGNAADNKALLECLSDTCREHQIQVLLSPLRYLP